MPKTLTDDDFNRLLASSTARFTVGFSHESKTGGYPANAGSGTLVRYRGIGGILTCAHVLRDALSHAASNGSDYFRIGINGAGAKLGSYRLQLQEFAAFKMIIEGGDQTAPSLQALGPDIGFVMLPPAAMSFLEARGSALNLDKQEELYCAGRPAGVTHDVRLASGVLKEGSENVIVASKEALLSYNVIVSGQLHREDAEAGFDRARFLPDSLSAFPNGQPESFKGLSGGAIWLAGLQLEDDQFKLVERRLFGVIYFETEPDSAGKRSLLFHARGSIYKKLLPQIAALTVET